jgi:hypothetical protein
LNLPALQAFFQDNPGRFIPDALSTQQNSLEQDFEAGEDVFAGYLMVGVDFSKWNLLAGARARTRRAILANELLFADGDFTGRTNPARGAPPTTPT